MPRFSIIITTTRPHLMENAIQSALAQDLEDFELVISDNSEVGGKEIVERYEDPRIRYIRPVKILSVAEHWDFAFSHAVGDWQLLLCDDDALAPNLLSILNRDIVAYPEVHTIRWKAGSWNDMSLVVPGASPTFSIPGFSGNRSLISTQELISQMFGCGIGLQSSVKKNIPILSFSVYSKEIIGKIRSAMNGHFCLPICPMTSSSLAALALSEKSLNIDLPLSVLGAPRESQAVLASTPERFEAWVSSWEFQFAPKQTMFTPTACHTETMLRIQSLLPEQLGNYRINWEEFFVTLFQQVMANDWNTPQKKSLARLESALKEFPKETQTSVHERILQSQIPPSWLQSLLRTVMRKARNAPIRIFFMLTLNFNYRDRILDCRRYGFNDLNDCAYMLGQITGSKNSDGNSVRTV